MNKAVIKIGLRVAYAYLNAHPEKNIPKLLNWLDRFDRNNAQVKLRNTVRKGIEDKGNWYKLAISLWNDIDTKVRRSLFNNLVIRSAFTGWAKQEKLRKKLACNIPWAILVDPSSACNLKCTGCWAAKYGNRLSLDYKTLDDIVEQGKKLGVHFYLFSGGEPLLRKGDIIKLCKRHKDCTFAAFTNGTLIDEAFADEMLRIKNFIPAISIEGFEEETDSRRGKGTYQAVMRAMKILKDKKLLFGASCCYTSRNTETIGSEAFFTELIKKGAKFAWFFTYIPVGADALPELMVSAEQRSYMYHRIRLFRRTMPMMTLDFWNDGEFVKGCIAGGRRYLHINAAGDIEPCAFTHYADTNIHNTSLLDALKSPLFMEYFKNQPFNENHLRPCPLLDNPERLVSIVEASGAKSTDYRQAENVRELCSKCVAAADKWAGTADRLWRETHGGKAGVGTSSRKP